MMVMVKMKSEDDMFEEVSSDELVDYDDIIGQYISGEYYPDDEAFTEMATILSDDRLKLRIQVNPDRNRVEDPYFKVFNATIPKLGETSVARLHFKDSGMGYHIDGYFDWDINDTDIHRIIDILNSPYRESPQYTNWQMACYLWNLEYALIDQDRNKYFRGEFDDNKHPSYVPSNQPIPSTWIHNPPKNKGKRK